ncbi:MAG: hypothetical protein L6R40_004308 [Gallowayella cf. fulva]|nr:MAG: hypothetical protein L6R40_004308 [Xanthomendoza cf. fulva]
MSTSAVGWQVDLPGLSSLVMNMGAAGLKKFAQAGVDVHTLLCMGEIAETSAACPEYRREINSCRQQLRKQSTLLYKIVEIGTASNFIADELLKKRAGENVVALMSTILPILPEEDCGNLILKLFEACKVVADKTPGFGQLQAFRDTILPLARKTAFKYKVFRYQILFNRLRPGTTQDRFSGVSNYETMVQLVLLCGRLVEDSRYILSYRGWQGSAWVTAYARHVLGLPVCVLRTPKDPVPINGYYHNSRVFVYIYEDAAECELRLAGAVADSIIAAEQDLPSLNRWMIDLDNVNLHDLYLPHGPQYDSAIPSIMRFMTSIFINKFIEHLNQQNRQMGLKVSSERAKPYLEYCLPQIMRRGLNILDRMGFRSSETEAGSDQSREHLEICKDSGRYSDNIVISPGPVWLQLSLATVSLDYENHSEMSSMAFSGGHFLSFTDGERIIRLLLWIADITSWLALSNWGETLRTLSTQPLTDGFRGLERSQISGHSDVFRDHIRFTFYQRPEPDQTTDRAMLEIHYARRAETITTIGAEGGLDEHICRCNGLSRARNDTSCR